MREFDVIVIGGGTAGITASLAAREQGALVALLEREARLGDDCTFYACVPSKALLEIAKLAHDLRQAVGEQVVRELPKLEFAKIAAAARASWRRSPPTSATSASPVPASR